MSSIAELVADIGFNIDQATIDGFKATLINTQNQLKSVFGEQYNLEIKDNTKEVKENIKENIEKPLEEAKKKAREETKVNFGLTDIISLMQSIKMLLGLYDNWRKKKKKISEEEKKDNKSNKFLMAEYGSSVKKEKEKEEESYMSLGDTMLSIIPIALTVANVVNKVSKVFKKDMVSALKSMTKEVIKNTIAWLHNPIVLITASLIGLIIWIKKTCGSFVNFDKGIDKNGKKLNWFLNLIRMIYKSSFILSFFVNLIRGISDGIKKVHSFKDAWIIFTNVCKKALADVIIAVMYFWDVLNKLFGFIKEKTRFIWKPLIDGFIEAIKFIKSIFQPVIDFFSSCIKKLISWVPKSIKKKFGIEEDVNVNNTLKDNELTNNLKSNLSATAPSVNNTNSSSKQDNRQITTTINVDGSKNPKETAREISNLQDEINNSSVVLNG